MADTKITGLQPPQPGYAIVPSTDVLPIVVIADPGMAASGSTRKATVNQILGAGGTATLASATITGDLTVDTNVLKVDSAGNRVIIGATSVPDTFLKSYITDAAAGTVGIGTGFSASAGYQGTWTNHPYVIAANGTEQLRVAPLGVFTFSDGAGGTRMTLNSTGLGVGGSPSYKLDVAGPVMRLINSAATADFFITDSGTTNGNVRLRGESNAMKFITGGGVSATIDSSGNVGVGVTPSAIGSTLKGIQVSPSSSTAVIGGYIGSTPLSVIAHNAFFDGTNWKRVYADYSSFYRQSDGTHRWELGGTGLAGATFSPTQAMTLNAAGSLVLGAAAVATTATDGFLYIPGCAGTPTGTPTAQTGRVPLVVDTTNNKLYFYSGGSWVAAN